MTVVAADECDSGQERAMAEEVITCRNRGEDVGSG